MRGRDKLCVLSVQFWVKYIPSHIRFRSEPHPNPYVPVYIAARPISISCAKITGCLNHPSITTTAAASEKPTRPHPAKSPGAQWLKRGHFIFGRINREEENAKENKRETNFETDEFAVSTRGVKELQTRVRRGWGRDIYQPAERGASI